MRIFKVAYIGKGTDKLLITEFKIEGKKYTFMIDTGATTNIIHNKRIKPFTLTDKSAKLQGFNVNEDSVRCEDVITDEGFKIKKALVTDLNFLKDIIPNLKGIIGLNFLIQNKIQIEFK